MTDDHIDIKALRAKYPLDSAGQWEAEGRHSLAEQRRDFHLVLDAFEAMQAERDAERRARERLETALRHVREAISSVPEDAFGTGGNGVDIPFYPIRDELVDSITKALTAEGLAPQPNDAEE